VSFDFPPPPHYTAPPAPSRRGPCRWQGRLESLAEWDAGHAAREGARASQGRTLSEWLSQTDELIAKRLLPLLTPAPADAAAGEAAAAAGRGGAAAERAASGGAASPAGPSPGAASPLASPVAPWVEEALRGGAVAAEGGTGAEEEADEDEGEDEDEDEDEEADEGDEDKGEGGARGHGA